MQQVAGGKEIRLNLVLALVLMLLPLADAGREDGMRVVPAQEILDKIERGVPVEYDHVIVEGDLDLRKLDLPRRRVERTRSEIWFGLSKNVTVVLSLIRLNDSMIDGIIYFNNTIFNTTDFTGTRFIGQAYFIGSLFNDAAYFIGSSFNYTADFIGSSFNDEAHFSRSSFNGSAYFWHSSFNGTVSFDDSSFNGPAHFSGSSFNYVADFIGSSFNGHANFRGSSFNGPAYFSGSSFNYVADFIGSSFNGPANFRDSSFNGSAYFSGSSLNDEVDFMDSSFNDSAYFDDSSFNRIVCFVGSTFNGTVDFSSSSFNGTVKFWDSTLNDASYFSGSSFNGIVDFEDSSFNGPASFWGSSFNNSDFYFTQFNKVVSFDDSQFKGFTLLISTRFKEDAFFEGADFNGTLYLNRAKYDKLYISWKNIKELGYDDAAYLALLENFKKLGYFEDYDACYYEYRRLHRDQDWSGKYHPMHPAEEYARKGIDVLLDVFYGYGKKPLWPLLWSIGTVLFFAIIWLMFGMNGSRGKNGRGIFERFGQQNARAKTGRYDWWGILRSYSDALLFSATVFLSGTRLFVEPPAQPEVQRLSASQVKWAMIFERVLGALFSILFFLAIGGTVVR